MNPNLPQLLLTIDQDLNGFITSAGLAERSVTYSQLRALLKSGELVQSDRGVYMLPNRLDDYFFNALYRYQKGIYSLNTALYLHNLSDRTPENLNMSFPREYNSMQIKIPNIVPFRETMRTYGAGAEEVRTPSNNIVRCYSIERTLCDIIRERNRQDIQIIAEAYKQYARRRNKNLEKLIEYAKLLRVEEKVRSYMEVIL